jgi:hypothetical protein
VRRFTVVWDDDVAGQLTTLCNNSFGTPRLPQITAAANRIDKELSYRPLEAGQPIGPMLRVLVAYPLAVECEVREEDCLVRLLGYYLCIPPKQ